MIKLLFLFSHSPSQSSDNFKTFLSSFEQVITDMSLSNPGLRLILGDFNCRSNYSRDGDISTKEGIDWNQSPCLMGFNNILQIQHIFFLINLPLALT